MTNPKLLTDNELRYVLRSTVALESFFWCFLWLSIFTIVFAIFPMLWINPGAAIFIGGIGTVILGICYFIGMPYSTEIEPYSYYNRGYFDEESVGTGEHKSYFYTLNGKHLKQPKALSILIGRLARSVDDNGYKPLFHCRLARYVMVNGRTKKTFYIILNIEDFYCIDTLYSSKKPFDFFIPTLIWLAQILYTSVFFITLFFGLAIILAVITEDEIYFTFAYLANIGLAFLLIFKKPDLIESLHIQIPTPISKRLKCRHNNYSHYR